MTSSSRSPSALSVAPGDVLGGKYRVDGVLGSGGMGVVVAATHLRIAQRVAIKLLLPETRNREDVVERFAREARAAAKLRGDHAVRILDVDDSEAGDPFMVMEFLEGRDLQQELAAEGALSVETTLAYALQACEGIAEAHAVGIVHRDLKPANLFLTKRPDGSPLVKILDFGISKALEVESPESFSITVPATAIGSPAYMSPEQLRDASAVDARSDIWALGVVVYQLLTNALPFEANTTASLAARIAADPPTPLRERRADVPSELAIVVEQCLAKDPAARFADVASLARALAPFAKSGFSGAERVARVADGAAQRSPAPAIGASPAVLAGPPTMSLHGDPAAPLERVPTEYGATIGTSATTEPRKSPLRWFVLGAAVITILALVISSRAHVDVAAPPPPVTAVALPAISESVAPPAVDASPILSASARPSAHPPRLHPKPPPKNPMDLDFR